tara:strand:+ start:494 stop:1813 length:1320 start_codon:yes stop_codon:yes gene_type:complete
MPVTFNSNNNYNVEIVTEPDVLNPTVIKYSSINNTPYIELKITPDIYQYPLIAGNMNFDGLYRFVDHHTQNNVNNSCTPIITPHGVNTTNTFGATNFTGTLANGSYCGIPPITANVTSSFQGPFQSHRSYGQILNDQMLNGVAWTKVIWVGAYEDDNGNMVNTVFSPEISEDIATWQLWDPNNPAKPITNNVYPIYIRAFVFLEFAPAGPNGLTSDIDIFIDIDEDTPIYGCTNSSATNYDPTATIDDGSCIFPPPPPPPPSFTLPPFTLAHTVDYSFIDLNYPTSPANPVFMATLSLDIQQAINALPNSTGVIYEITELYYIDDTGAQVDLQHTTNSSLLTPPFGLTSIPPFNLTHYFATPPGSNIATGVTLGPLPIDVTLYVPPSVIAQPVQLPAIIFPRYGTNPFYSTSIDVHCTVTATDTSIFTASDTQTLTITL